MGTTEKVFDYTGSGSEWTNRVSLAFDGKDYLLTVCDRFGVSHIQRLAPETATVLNDMWSDHLVKVRAIASRKPVAPPALRAVPTEGSAS